MIKEGVAHIYPAVEITPADAGSDPPVDYEILKTENISALRERTRWEFPELSTRFRVLSALMKSRILDDNEGEFSREGSDDIDNSGQTSVVHARGKVPRLHDWVLAYVINVLMEVDLDNNMGSTLAAIERINNTIALREYGQGADPQVMFEMWRLQNCSCEGVGFRRQPRLDEKHTGYRRLEQYLEDIPVDTVEKMF